MNRRHGYG